MIADLRERLHLEERCVQCQELLLSAGLWDLCLLSELGPKS